MTTAFENIARPCVRDVTPYLPGKPIAEVQRELGLKRVVKLASNENALGPSPRALAALRRSFADSHLYPEGTSPLLRHALAREFGLTAGHVVVGNGSDEIIRLLCEAFLAPADEVVVSRYGFIRFKQQAMLMGAKIVEVPMSGWRHDLAAMGRSVGPGTKLVFVASPNNPTGTHNARDELRALLKSLPDTAILVLDEAYCQYALSRPDYPDSVREFLPGRSNLVLLRTFSKVYGLAGLRVGFGLAAPELIGWLDRIRMPFNVNLPGQRAALAALEDRAFVRRSVRLVEGKRAALARALGALGLDAAESSANFLFVGTPVPGEELFRRLLRHGVIVRPLDEYGLPRHVRISIGTREQNAVLLKAMERALAG